MNCANLSVTAPERSVVAVGVQEWSGTETASKAVDLSLEGVRKPCRVTDILTFVG